jgi:starvation-inducible DNA-binding protein
VNDDVEEYVDLIAERAVQLGGVAEGTARSVAKRTTLAEYAARGPDPRDHVQALSSALSTFGKAGAAIARTADLGDADTADVFTEISRGADKWLWMVEAHVPTER